MITSDSVRKDPVPIKYYNNNIYNIANNDNVEALSRDKAMLVRKGLIRMRSLKRI